MTLVRIVQVTGTDVKFRLHVMRFMSFGIENFLANFTRAKNQEKFGNHFNKKQAAHADKVQASLSASR